MSTFIAKSPSDVVHIDIVGPLPLTTDGNSYVISMMGRFSRLEKVAPLPSITASILARALHTNWILEYGPPGRMITDRGTQVTSTVLKILFALFGCKMSFTTAYHPKTNGTLERFHGYMKQRFKIFASQLVHMWFVDWVVDWVVIGSFGVMIELNMMMQMVAIEE